MPHNLFLFKRKNNMKPKTSAIKLYTKPEEGKLFGDWDFVWLTVKEIIPEGYKRVKNLKRRIIHDVESSKLSGS
jgi:hypothetical protein